MHAKLSVPTIVDQYNHQMGAVDISDQLCVTLCRFRRQIKGWKVLFQWLLHIRLVNTYLLHRTAVSPNRPINQRDFWTSICKGLKQRFQTELANHTQATQASNKCKGSDDTHKCVKCPIRQRCAQCTQHKQANNGNLPKIGRFRTVLGEITPSWAVEVQQRPIKSGRSRTCYGCDTCDIALCRDGRCWDEWHMR